MTRRSGVTLVEVLVAIFVMGIGLIALLTLFPIGMLRVAQALGDARSVESADNAHSIAIAQNIANDPLVITDNTAANPDFFKNNGQAGAPDADPYGESYAVFVDPIGYTNTNPGNWVGGVPGVLRRRPVSFVAGTNIYRNFTLGDDINFDNTAAAAGTPQRVGPVVLRETRFSWGYVYRRPQTSDRSVVECSIVVFDKRSVALTSNLTLAEYVYKNKAYFNPTNNTITIDYTNNVPPPLRPGDWIMDATVITSATGAGSSHAYFYRVVSTEDFAGNLARYEVQNPIRGFAANTPLVNDPITNQASSVYQGTAIVMEGVREVYEKGVVRQP